jgi:hypothetical protein
MFGMKDMVKGHESHDEGLAWHIYVVCNVPWAC